MKKQHSATLIKGKREDKSGLASSGLKAISSLPVTAVSETELDFTSNLELMATKHFNAYAGARLMMLFGCRVSEVLNIRGCDIDKTGRIQIFGLKGSANRIIVDSEVKDFWLTVRNPSQYKVFEFNRQYMWRLFKECGIRVEMEGQERARVTHAFRHVVAKEVSTIADNLTDVRDFMGRKWESSTKNYTES